MNGADDWSEEEKAGLRLLLDGADSRALNAYGISPALSDSLAMLGSCTANPPGREQCLRSAHAKPIAHGKLEDTLAHFFGARKAIACASGTDAEYLASLALGQKDFFSLAIDGKEVGSGCFLAAQGLPHALGGPVEAPLGIQAKMAVLKPRDENGDPLSTSESDALFLELARIAEGGPALLRICPCTKTGLSLPSEDAMSYALSQNPNARCLVDASQGRFERHDLDRWLSKGWAVIATGSKRWGSAPFCGVVLFGEQMDNLWPGACIAHIGSGISDGLCARWQSALELAQHIGTWCMSPLERRQWSLACEMFSKSCANAIVGHEMRQGIFSFDVGLDLDQSRKLWRLISKSGFFVGQPVDAGSKVFLRVAHRLGQDIGQIQYDLSRLSKALPSLIEQAKTKDEL